MIGIIEMVEFLGTSRGKLVAKPQFDHQRHSIKWVEEKFKYIAFIVLRTK